MTRTLTFLPTRIRDARGFTLIEMLAVVVLAGIVIAMVSISAAPNPHRALREQGEQLVQLLIVAQDEALVGGRPILWEADVEGFRFSVKDEQGWHAPDNALLRARPWKYPLQRIALDSDVTPRLLFTREVLSAPVRLQLERDGAQAVISGDTLGRFRVEP